MPKIEPWQLKQRQSLPLHLKIKMSERRIREWYEHWDGQVYVSFSGGKDSTVLLHLVRSMYPDVEAVFVDTGLEYPEIKEFVRTIEGVTVLRPKMSFKRVIEKYGYPLLSKEQAQNFHELRTTKSEKLRNIRLHGNKWGQGKISAYWEPLTRAPFKISHKCCDVMKKQPAKKFEKESGKKAFLGTMTDESSLRKIEYLKHGCNAFESKRPMSTPLSFWLEKDIWEYIREFDVPYSKIYDMGYERTGCMFCLFGIHLEESHFLAKNRFQRMKETHPKLHKYCIEKLGIGEVLDYIKVPYE